MTCFFVVFLSVMDVKGRKKGGATPHNCPFADSPKKKSFPPFPFPLVFPTACSSCFPSEIVSTSEVLPTNLMTNSKKHKAKQNKTPRFP